MSYYWIGETLQIRDIMMIGCTFIAVTLITFGFIDDKHIHPEPSIWAGIACLFLPILLSYAQILMNTMKGLH